MKKIVLILLISLSCASCQKQIEYQWNSMNPTIKHKEIINYIEDIDWIKRWDIVVYKIKNAIYSKRVIWLWWDKLKIVNGNVFIYENGVDDYIKLEELYLDDSDSWKTYVRWTKEEYIYDIPKDNYFILWDNRSHSTDSRVCFTSCWLEWALPYIYKDMLLWKVIQE